MAFAVPRPLQPLWSTLSDPLRDELRNQHICTITVFCKLFAVPEERVATVLELDGAPSDVAIIEQLVGRLRTTASSEARRIAATPMPEVSVAVALASRQREKNMRELGQAAIVPLPVRTKRAALSLEGLTVVSRRRLSSLDASSNAREQAEDRRREKWLHELRDLIAASGRLLL